MENFSFQNTGDGASQPETSNKEPSQAPHGGAVPNPPPSRERTTTFWRRVLLWGVVLIAVFGAIVGSAAAWQARQKQANSAMQVPESPASRFDPVQLSLQDFVDEGLIAADPNAVFTVNGQLRAANTLVVAPTAQPNRAVPGQIYYDQGTNQLAYYNGAAFVTLDETDIPVAVNSLGGASGTVGVGTGLAVAGGVLQNTGVLNLTAGSSNLTVTNNGSGSFTVTASGGGGGTVASPGGTAGRIAKFSAAQTIEDSLLSEASGTVTLGGNLTVTGTMGLGSPLGVTSGGTGAASLTANGVLLGNGTGAVGSLVAGGAGQCLVSTAGAPSWQVCPGGGAAVTSLNGATGALTIANASEAGGTITLNDASTGAKGIAQFNSSNFSVASGVVNTIQDIGVAATPTFGRLSVASSQASAAMLTVNNTNAGATGNLLSLQLNGADRFTVDPAGNVVATGTLTSGAINGQTISGAANFTGSVAIATTLNVNTITPTGALTVGATNQNLILQGAATSITSTSGANTTALSLQTPAANVTYRLLTASAGTYDICTTSANCVGLGGGVTTLGGTTNRLAKFTGSQTVGDSILTDNGSTVTVAGTLAATTALQAPLLDTASAAALNVGTTNATQINLNQNVQLASGKSLTLAGAFAMQPAADSTSVFNIKNNGAANLLTVDSSNSRVGINLGGSNLPNSTLEVGGSLRLSSALTESFVTPFAGSSVPTKLNIPAFDPGSFGQLVAMGLPSGAQTTARALSLFDARTVAHQPTLAVFSASETEAAGFSWEGGNSTAYLKTTGGNWGIRSNATDIMTLLSGGNVGVGVSPSYKFDVAGDINTSTALRIGGVSICSSGGCTPASGSGNYIQNGTSLQTGANMAIESASDAGVSLLIKNRAAQSADTLRIVNAGNSVLFNIDTFGSGYINNQLTVNTYLGVGVSSSSGAQIRSSVANANTIGLKITANSSQVADLIEVDGSGTRALQYTGTGTLVVTAGSGQAAALLNLNDTSGTPLFSVDASGNANTTAVYKVGGVSGINATCSGGQVLQNLVANGGIVTGGSCAAMGGETLQEAYDNSSSPATLTTSAAGKGISIAAGAVHTADILSISNAGQGITTAGVEGLSINYVGGAAAVESSGLRIDVTPGGTSGGTWSGMQVVANSTGAASGVSEYGIKVEGPSSPGAGTEMGVNVTSGWDIGVNISSGGLQLSTQSDPSAPAANTLRVYAKNFAGKSMLTALDSQNGAAPLQAALFSKTIVTINTLGGYDSADLFGVGDTAIILASGGFDHVYSQAYGWRQTLLTTSTGGAGAGAVASGGQWDSMWQRGNAVGANGFFSFAKITLPDSSYTQSGASTGSRIFVGMKDGTDPIYQSNWFSADNPSGHRVGFSYVSNGSGRQDTAWQFTTRDGTTQTLQATGMNFAAQKQYDFYMYCPPQCTTIYWRIDNISDGTTQEGSQTATLPGSTTKMAMGAQLQTINNVQRELDISRMYIEADR